MNWKDAFDGVVALGTLAAAVFAGISARVAAKTAKDAAKAMDLHREELRAQSFLKVIGYETEIQFSEKMDIIRGLTNEAKGKLNTGEAKAIRDVVDFLNPIAHLIRHRYIVPQHILYLYSPSITACRANLIGAGKWLDSFRAEHGDLWYYLHFECLCREGTLKKLWRGAVEECDWPKPSVDPSPVLR